MNIFKKIEALPDPARTFAGLALILALIILTSIIENL